MDERISGFQSNHRSSPYRAGGRTLRPFEEPVDERIDPLQAYGYWVEGFVSVASRLNSVRTS